jgi:hypothetical protein
MYDDWPCFCSFVCLCFLVPLGNCISIKHRHMSTSHNSSNGGSHQLRRAQAHNSSSQHRTPQASQDPAAPQLMHPDASALPPSSADVAQVLLPPAAPTQRCRQQRRTAASLVIGQSSDRQTEARRGPGDMPPAVRMPPAYTPTHGLLTFLHNPYTRTVPRTVVAPLVMLQSALIAILNENQEAMNAIDAMVMPRDHVLDLRSVRTFQEFSMFANQDVNSSSYSHMICNTIMRASRRLKLVGGSISLVRAQFLLQHRMALVYNEVVLNQFGGRFHDFVGTIPTFAQFVVRQEHIDAHEDLHWVLKPHERRIATSQSILATMATDAEVGRNIRSQVIEMFLPRYIAHMLDVTVEHTDWARYDEVRELLWKHNQQHSSSSSSSQLQSKPPQSLPSVCYVYKSAAVIFGKGNDAHQMDSEILSRANCATPELIASFIDIINAHQGSLCSELRLQQFQKKMCGASLCLRLATNQIVAKIEREFPPLVCIMSNIRLHGCVTKCLMELLSDCCLEGPDTRGSPPGAGVIGIESVDSADCHAHVFQKRCWNLTTNPSLENSVGSGIVVCSTTGVSSTSPANFSFLKELPPPPTFPPPPSKQRRSVPFHPVPPLHISELQDPSTATALPEFAHKRHSSFHEATTHHIALSNVEEAIMRLVSISDDEHGDSDNEGSKATDNLTAPTEFSAAAPSDMPELQFKLDDGDKLSRGMPMQPLMIGEASPSLDATAKAAHLVASELLGADDPVVNMGVSSIPPFYFLSKALASQLASSSRVLTPPPPPAIPATVVADAEQPPRQRRSSAALRSAG